MASASAVTNWYASPGVLEPRVFTDLVDKAMDLVWERRDQVTPQLMPLFEKVTSQTGSFKTSSVSSIVDLPIKSEDTQPLPYTQPAPGYDKTFTTVNYRRAIRATDDMRSMDLFGKVQLMISGLPKAATRLQEYACANVFNNAFADVIGADGMYLCDTDHPSEDNAAAKWDNLTTAAALSPATFSASRVALRKRKNEKGYVDPIAPKILLTGPGNEEMVYKILNANLQPQTALNDPNWNKSVVQPMIADWITSTTSWFLIGDLTGPARGLFYVERVAPNVKPVTYSDPDIIWGRRLKIAFTVGFTTCRGIEGNAGA
jgi:hypothetical protein